MTRMTKVLNTITRADGDYYELLAQLPIRIDRVSLAELQQVTTPEFTRRTTVIRLHGDGEAGVGEDSTPTVPGGVSLARSGLTFELRGDWTLASLSAHLDTLDLAVTPPWLPSTFRRWGIESAALDLALRQAGRSLASVLGIAPRPVRFVNSLRLTEPPTLEPVFQRLNVQPGLRFKLDPTPGWNETLIAALAATRAVDIVDFKGQYPAEAPIAVPPDVELYARVADAFPDAWLEDPAVTAETESVLRRFADRVTWDVPIGSVADIGRLPFVPRAINVKPARIGTVRLLLELYDRCATRGIGMYGGGMFELGPGRGQIQYLASLFHPDAANDVAPTQYNERDLAPMAPASPVAPSPTPTGFRWV
jgi:L-alanine-DL-glutamate epimerase-like enolase superfamily enzyme